MEGCTHTVHTQTHYLATAQKPLAGEDGNSDNEYSHLLIRGIHEAASGKPVLELDVLIAGKIRKCKNLNNTGINSDGSLSQ